MNSLSQMIGGGAVKPWVSGRTYQQGALVLSPADNYQLYVRVTAAGSGATDPSSDSTNYKPCGGRAIKSIQRGEFNLGSGATSATATISAVNTSRSVLHWLGSLGINGAGNTALQVRLALTNSTTITGTANGQSNGNLSVAWQLVEYYG